MTVRDAFRACGFDARSVDLLPTEGDPAFHIQGDALAVLGDGWDLMIAHPSCTYLTNAGVRWLHTQEGRPAPFPTTGSLGDDVERWLFDNSPEQ